jgi:hypothetical protein
VAYSTQFNSAGVLSFIFLTLSLSSSPAKSREVGDRNFTSRPLFEKLSLMAQTQKKHSLGHEQTGKQYA